MNQLKGITGAALAFAFALVTLGCGGSANAKASRFDAATGVHPTNWLPTHYVDFVKNPDACRTCHGSTTDPAQAGGVAKVSCFTCHASGPSHPTGWGAGLQHGRLGAQAAPGQFTGIAECMKCHGSNYDNPMVNVPSCKACHTLAPHPARPWLSGNPALSSHVATDQGNAPQCYRCHANGANSTVVPITPAPPGTTPGCFNNTMCHGNTFP